ncbi:hypothetical protein AVEN_205577-1, partial [Araneus ventricosus]
MDEGLRKVGAQLAVTRQQLTRPPVRAKEQIRLASPLGEARATYE